MAEEIEFETLEEFVKHIEKIGNPIVKSFVIRDEEFWVISKFKDTNEFLIINTVCALGNPTDMGEITLDIEPAQILFKLMKEYTWE